MKKCKICGKEYKKNEIVAHYLPKAMQENMSYIPDCDCYEKEMEKKREEERAAADTERIKAKIKRFKDISVIDSKFKKSTFEDADMSDGHMIVCKNFSQNFVANGKAPKGMLLFGSVGNGKTYAGACIANHLMENGKTVLVIRLGLYLIKIQQEWAKAESDVLDQVAKCDLLLIDDFGAEKVSDFVREKTFNLIDARYRSEKACVITSNLDIENMKKKFGDTITDRISEMCYPIAVMGESRRANSKDDEFLDFIARRS